MSIPETMNQYFLKEERVASFLSVQRLSKRRASNAPSRAPKPLKWPHPFLPAEEMAKAGFFFYPSKEHPDNTMCFLCQNSIDGWERGDSPLVEHLALSPNCGWAVVASIDAQNEVLCRENSMSERMIEARKATFGDWWPHEHKKGWKCKIKQMIDAGWKFTPTSDSDDMATCVYCDLALDGWEPSDKPLEEHFKRSPKCTFFTLASEHRQTTPKKAAKSRKQRASKASRLSTQSAATVTSEAPSVVDLPAELEDSILTTVASTTVMSQGGRKMTRGKRAGVGRKTKAKKDEPIEVSIIADPEPEDEVKVEKTKATRGKKRTSDAIDESSLTITSQQQPAKRRATRTTRGSVARNDIHVPPSIEDNHKEMITLETTVLEKKTINHKGRGSVTKPTRYFSTASAASKALLQMRIADDEIERALQADLERPLTDEEDNALISQEMPVAAAPTASVRKTTRVSKTFNADHVLFGVGEITVDETSIEAELEAMEVEKPVPLSKAKGAKGKQGRKPSAKQQAAARRAADSIQANNVAEIAAEALDSRDSQLILNSPQIPKVESARSRVNTRKPSTRGTRASALSVNMSNASLLSIDQPSIDIHSDSGNESDASIASQATIVRTGPKRRGSALKNAKGGKKAMARNIEEIVSKQSHTVPDEQAPVEKAPKKRAGRLKKVIHAEENVITEDVTYAPLPISQQPPVEGNAMEPAKAKATGPKGKGKALPETPIGPREELLRQATPPPKELTPSLSPQSSNAENHPPSKPPTTKPLNQNQTVRIPLATSTPIASPSKRNIVAGLQTTYLWTTVDLDEVFLQSPSQKENTSRATSLLATALGKAKRGDLTSPERKMTVEEWIMFNATLAEEKLRGECEQMVGVFEREGGRAMRVLEGVEC